MQVVNSKQSSEKSLKCLPSTTIGKKKKKAAAESIFLGVGKKTWDKAGTWHWLGQLHPQIRMHWQLGIHQMADLQDWMIVLTEIRCLYTTD